MKASRKRGFFRFEVSFNRLSKLRFDYDDRLRLSKIELRDSSQMAQYLISYVYDKDNNLSRVGELEIKRDSNGLLTQSSLKKAQTFFSSDSVYGELSKIESRFNNSTVYLREFKRDKLGRIIEEKSEDGHFTIFYDKAGRLAGRSSKNSGGAVSSFTYDKNGNRVKGFDGKRSFTASFDAQDRLTRFNNSTYLYNPNGELSQKNSPEGLVIYAYDSFGNLRTVDYGYKKIDYDIDNKNRRAARRENGVVVARYVWQDQLRIAGELNASGILQKRFVYGTGINVPDYMIYQNRKYFFVKDHRGSVNLVVDSETGEIKQKMRYSEWGEVIEDTNPGFQPFGFAGGLYDSATKLHRFGARDYDPEIGRWLSKDPIRFDGGDGNLYGYVLKDPQNNIDPRGLDTYGFGFSFSGSGFGFSFSGGAQYVWDDKGNSGVSLCVGVGAGGATPSLALTADGTKTNADNINSLAGPGYQAGGSVSNGITVGGSVNGGNGFQGGTGSVGIGTPGFGFGTMPTGTTIIGF